MLYYYVIIKFHCKQQFNVASLERHFNSVDVLLLGSIFYNRLIILSINKENGEKIDYQFM